MFHCSAKPNDVVGAINAIIAAHAQVMIFCVIPLGANLHLDMNTKIIIWNITFAGGKSSSMTDSSAYCTF